MTEQLVDRLARVVGTLDPDDRADLTAHLDTAAAYLRPHVNGYDVPQPVLDDCLVAVAADLWQARDARNGVMSVNGDGIEPYRISADPLRVAWPKLRAIGIPAGMGVA